MDFAPHCDDRAHGDAQRDVVPTAAWRPKAARPAVDRCSSAVGAGWYHEAAIEAARQGAIEARCNPYGSSRP